ncbi:MAG TPA: branched-chain amino acid ABC transporter permease [Burkholderiales bacterium]|nr:branched-chain amino acid ABC transporter permease [Burkholderiales bacterium]
MKRLAAFSAILLFFLVLPLFIESRFWLGFWTTTLFFALLGQSWNILGGYGGQVSFGHAVFFGTGAYVSAVLQVRLGLDAWTSAAIAVAAGALVGAFIGALSFRYGLRGSYFALVTLAFAEVFRVLVNAWDFTGSGFGMLVPMKPGAANLQFADRTWFYYAILLLVFLAYAITWRVERSRFGAYLLAIRENEDAARALGINAFRIKLAAITLSGAMAAVAGVFYIQYYLFVDSHVGYGPAMSVNALLAPLIGGAGTVLGPLIGAIALGSLAELTSLWLGKQPGVNLLAFGVLLLVILRFLPNGLMGLLRGRS